MGNENKNNNIIKEDQLQRTFILGDKWLYYKFYTGPKTADIVLTQMIKPLSEDLLSVNAIDKWFFIRYGDPKLHTRVRFHVTETRYLLDVITQVAELSRSYIDQNLIWKVQTDSYQREVERYGVQSMELAETYFYHDSRMLVDMLDMIEGDEGERIRWLFALRTIDFLLEDFKFSMEDKYNIVTMLRENFGREHGMNRSLKEQMEKKYRRDRKEIEAILGRVNDEDSMMYPLFQLIDRKSQDVRPITAELLKLYNNETANPFYLNDLIASYSHMTINRLFKSKQRTHEMVVYDFLHRYYKSQIARAKYSKTNKKKKKK
ncbi:MAG: hypothetical protein GY765_27610 [bacterium]|nr:hypothetical protein [bacterium]